VAPVVGGQSHGNLQPLLVITYIIALSGAFPAS
jgi:microcystin-dependent protein